jgi:hypothetical protein
MYPSARENGAKSAWNAVGNSSAREKGIISGAGRRNASLYQQKKAA